jgi:chromosome segregation ATPase
MKPPAPPSDPAMTSSVIQGLRQSILNDQAQSNEDKIRQSNLDFAAQKKFTKELNDKVKQVDKLESKVQDFENTVRQ